MAANLVRFRTKYNNAHCLSQINNSFRSLSDDTNKKKTNLYETLGVSSSATHREIKQAYYDKTMKYHPDRNENCETAALKFREVSEAYEILGNYGLRKKYDRGIPVSTMKKAAKQTVVHKAQFQEFFDSRTEKQTAESHARVKELEDLSSFAEEKNRRDADESEKPNEVMKSNNAIAAIITVSVCVLVYLSR